MTDYLSFIFKDDEAEDAILRNIDDFNAIYYDIKNDKFIDIYGGIEDIKNKVTANGTSWEQFLDLQGQENIWNNLRDEAQKRIKNSLVLEHISKVENIKLEDDAIEKKVSEMAKMYNTDEKTVYNQMSKNPQILQSLIQQLISQNIIDFLVENKVNYVTK